MPSSKTQKYSRNTHFGDIYASFNMIMKGLSEKG
jgi:hypothetical protein